MSTLQLPESYATLPFHQIRLAHIPSSSPIPTPVILVTLYRPNNNNAFTGIMMAELQRVFKLFDADDRIKCIVVTGYGKMFCAGADLDDGFKRDAGKTATQHRDRYEHCLSPSSRC